MMKTTKLRLRLALSLSPSMTSYKITVASCVCLACLSWHLLALCPRRGKCDLENVGNLFKITQVPSGANHQQWATLG